MRMKVAMGIGLGLVAVGCLGLFGCGGDDDDSDTPSVTTTNTVNQTNNVTVPVAPRTLYTTTESWAMHQTKSAGVHSPAAGFVTATVVSHIGSDMRATLIRGTPAVTVEGPLQGANLTLRTAAASGQYVGVTVQNPSGVAVTCTLTLTYTPD
jgi:hypothetical protein